MNPSTDSGARTAEAVEDVAAAWFWKKDSGNWTEQDQATGEAAVEHLEISSPGTQSAAEFDQTIRDVTAFLEYAGEPAALKRPGIGVWVLLFLSFLTLLAWLMKNEYWKDVH